MTNIFTKCLVRTFLGVLSLVFFTNAGVAQSADIAPNVQNQITNPSLNDVNALPLTEEDAQGPIAVVDAQWDLQFNYAASDSANIGGGLAGAYFVGTEFWVSRWQSDTLYRFDNTGSLLDTLLIDNGGTTLRGTRSITSDGVNVYIGNATDTIFEVNPTTFTVTNTIISQGQTARFCTYDSTADNGNGGFWIGNFNTDIDLISRTGAVLQTITGATHGVGGIYGATVDNFSTGGPYLWVFGQNGTPSNGAIFQLSLPNGGIQTGIVRDVDGEIGSGQDISGGLFISDQIIPGEVTLGGLLQSEVAPNRLFGYELDFVPIQVDAAFSAAGLSPALGQIPERFNQPITFGGSVDNLGAQTLTSLGVDLSVDYGGTVVHTDNVMTANLPNLQTYNFTFPAYAPTAQGDYTATMTTNTGAQVDEVPGNNSVSFPFSITDSVLGRDDGVHAGGDGYAVSSMNAGLALTLYEFPTAVYLRGVEIVIANPDAIAGQQTSAIVVFVPAPANQPNGAPLLTSNPVTIVAGQNEYYLPFSTELPIAAGGIWGIGVTEGANTTINLSQSLSYFSPNTNYWSTDNGTTWNLSSIATARFIRPILAPCSELGVDFDKLDYNPSFNGDGEATAIPVKNRGNNITYQWDDPNNSTTETITGLMPGTYTVTITDVDNSCSATASVEIRNTTSIENDLAAGINNFKIYPNPTNGVINLDIEMATISDLTLELVDLNGRSIFTESHQKVNVFNKSFDLSSLSKGVYVLQATTSQGRTFKRVILD